MYLNFEKLCDVIADILLEFVSSAKSKSLLYLTEERLIGLLIKKVNQKYQLYHCYSFLIDSVSVTLNLRGFLLI